MTNKLRGRRFGMGAVPAVAGLLALAAFRRPADDNPIQVIAQKLSAFYASTLPEKAYLHLDRPAYGTGETMWFSAYVVDAQLHRPDTLSKVLHVELLSPQRRVVVRRTLKLVGGRAAGDIALDDTLRAGTYLLRAYTNWMRNVGPPDYLYQRQVQVWPAAPNQSDAAPKAPLTAAGPSAKAGAAAAKVDVQFFAEGGALLAGAPATVGFKAVAASGRGVVVSGQLLDEQNKPVGAAFSSQHAGMGRLSFTPAAGQRYHARLRLPDGSAADYPLPAVQATGYALRVLDAGENFVVEARYRGVPGAPVPGPALLLTEVRGFLIGLVPRPITDDGAPVTWRVAKARYPSGIVHFTLFDAQNTPQAERLAFVLNGPAALQVALTPDKAAYAPHDPVHVKVRVVNAAGQPVATRFSVSVAEAGAAALDPDAGTIASNLLLTSDLAGYVEGPGYYFQTQTDETKRALDNLLLTQGWRRYVWKDVLSGQVAALAYPRELALTLGGTVTGMGQRPIPNSQLTFIQTRPQRSVATATTGTDGRFRFIDFPENDTSVITLQARRAAGGSNVIIRPDFGPPTTGPALPPLPSPITAPGVADYVRRSRQQQVQERQNRPEGDIRNVELANVAVTAKRVLVPPDDPRRLYPGVVANTVVDFTTMPAAQSGIPILTLLQGRVAGLTITGSPPNVSAQIRGSGSPQFILDGVRTDIDMINNIPSSNVESVEVFKGAEAAIFGGSGGVIAIYTKRADRNYKEPASPFTVENGIVTVRLPGFYRAQEFYQPRYGAPVLNAPTMDARRLTLYWDPAMRTDASGQTEFVFYTADGGGNFQITAEGISLAGEPSRGTGQVYVAPKQR